MEDAVERLIAFLKAHTIIVVAVVGAVWIIALILGLLIGAASDGVDETSREHERVENEQYRTDARLDETLLSKGHILSTRDNTPPEKIRLYSRLQRKKIELRTNMFDRVSVDPSVFDEATIRRYQASVRRRHAKDAGKQADGSTRLKEAKQRIRDDYRAKRDDADSPSSVGEGRERTVREVEREPVLP